MKPITGVIAAVGKGEVSVRFKGGRILRHTTDRDFKYGERVLVLWDHHHHVIKDMFYPKELDQSEPAAPECPPLERSVDDKVLDSGVEDSFPTPDGRLLEFCEEVPGLELGLEPESSLSTPDGRSLEFYSGDDV